MTCADCDTDGPTISSYIIEDMVNIAFNNKIYVKTASKEIFAGSKGSIQGKVQQQVCSMHSPPAHTSAVALTVLSTPSNITEQV